MRKIAVLRANAVGDFLFVLPALEALRAAYPHAELILLGRAWHADFLRDRPGPVDRVVVVPPSQGVNADDYGSENPEELERFFTAMVRERFDLALQLHGGGRYSNPFLRRLGARRTVGLRTPDAAPLDHSVPYVYFQPEILRYLEVVRQVGAEPVTLEPRITLTPADHAEAEAVLPADARPLVALHPGCGAARRRWPPAKFAAVGDALASDGARLVITGSGGEHVLAQATAEAMHADAENICGRLTLGGLAALLARCRLVVSNDSGPLHVALAVGTPTVGIYWCGNLITAGPCTRSQHRPVLSWRLECPLCGRNCIQDPCTHEVSFVADVPVPEVLAAARELFQAAVSEPAQRLHPIFREPKASARKLGATS